MNRIGLVMVSHPSKEVSTLKSNKSTFFGSFLIEEGVITSQQLADLLEEQKKTRLRLGELIIAKNIISENQVIEMLAKYLELPFVKLYNEKITADITRLIPRPLAVQYWMIPYKLVGNTLGVAMIDPMNYPALDEVRILTGYTIEPAFATKLDIQRAINRFFSGIQENVDMLMQDVKVEENHADVSAVEENSPMVKTVNQLIIQAFQGKASDIHIEPHANALHIRYRVDGVLRTEQRLPIHMHSQMIARIKIMANLNVSERRLPQDGRIKVELIGKKIELRVSTLPSIFGEKIVMRLLGGIGKRNVEDLNLSSKNLHIIKQAISQPHGLFIIAGPTGSGKSTTLYSAISSLDYETMNIITIEDPIEQQINGITQSQVKTAIGYTFASGLRTILRQDPDVIMLGEIRDVETAEIAIRAAMTGHLVLTTLHTNTAINTVSRLVDMGIAPFLVASSLECVVSQRLARHVCPNCAVPYTPTPEERHFLDMFSLPSNQLRKGQGCFECGMTGYQGRIGIHEVLAVDSTMKSMIVQRASEEQFEQYTKKNGFIPIRHDGMIKVSQGLTTIEEVLRIS